MNPPVSAAQLTSAKTGVRPDDTDILTLAFDDNRLLSLMCGGHDEHLALIEHKLAVDMTPRGNRLAVKGTAAARAAARDVLATLYNRAKRGLDITRGDVEGAIRMREDAEASETNTSGAVRTRRKLVMPRTPMQGRYVEAIRRHELVFGIGPAGTGKTYLAVACAAEALMAGDVDRIVLSRPAVEAGERLGFLPGDMKEKVDPYLRPLYDALYDMLPTEQVERRFASGEIEIAPFAFMRGRTLSDAFVILDEAQNTTPQQMKMFLTRLGEGSRMVVTGDPTQVDLPSGVTSGLADAVSILKGVKSVAAVEFNTADIVRHALVGRIVAAYDKKAVKPRK